MTSNPPSPTPAAGINAVLRVLHAAGKITEAEAIEFMRVTTVKKVTALEAVLESKKVSSAEIAKQLSARLSIPLIDVGVLTPEQLPQDALPQKLAQDLRVIALSLKNGRLTVVTADPTNKEANDQIKFASQKQLDLILGDHEKILEFHAKLYKPTQQSTYEAMGGDESLLFEEPEAEAPVGEESTSEVDDAPIVKFLTKMIQQAVEMRASDLHFEPFEFTYRVRFRIDGDLREIISPPPHIKNKLASRIKVISAMDISEKRVPQDGRMKMKIGEKVIDFRVSTLPTLFGEKIVIRILDPSSAKVGIEALGYEKVEKDRLLAAVQRPYGMVLVTGPTGSGKTVSLYTCLNILNQPGVNISTAEDPAEINLPGVNQVNVNDKAGLTFEAALKSFLRQDPDVIMVGEIRDIDTANMAIKAAQTGHMVLSTLHTNDAPTTLTRLLNMGVAPFNIASSVILITAQRLAKRLCEHCKVVAEYPRPALLRAGYKEEDLNETWKPYRAVGCDKCNNGYRGRVGIYQVMPITEAIQTIILQNGTALDIAKQAARDDVRNLRESGLVKVRKGLTTIEEVLAVTNE